MADDTEVRQRQTVRVALEVASGPHQGKHFEFDRYDTFLVGRGSWSHLCLQDDLHFSRHHFRIEIRPPDCYLVDLGSRNGTFVNGNRVNATFLRDGDVISGGKTEIRVSVTTGRPRVAVDAPTVLGSFKSTITFERPASVARPCGNMGHQVGGPGGAALHGGYYPIID